MLVLSRKVGEAIIIGGDVRVVLVQVKGATARLGIDAPASVIVDRQEVHEQRREFADDGTAPIAGASPLALTEL